MPAVAPFRASAGTTPCAVDGQPVEREAGGRELAQRFDDGRMFDGAGEESAGRVAGEAEEGEVVGLGGAAGEDDFVGMGAEQGGGLLAGVFQARRARRPARMAAGRIAVAPLRCGSIASSTAGSSGVVALLSR